MTDLEAIRRRANEATAGPWEYVRAQRQQDGAWDYGIGAKIDGTKRCIAETFGRVADDVYPPVEANATFIAHARQDVPMLCDEVERLRAQLPDGMKDCSIVFKECEKGHGRLTATNWVQHECHWCELDHLRALLLTRAQEVWESAAKIADQFANTKADLSKSDNPYTANAIASIMSETGAKIAAAIRSRIPPSIGGERRVENLAMMLRRFIWQAGKQTDDTSLKALSSKALELLRQYGLEGSPLRGASADVETAVQSEANCPTPKTHNPDERAK